MNSVKLQYTNGHTKSLAFLYTSHLLSKKKKIKTTTPLALATENEIILEINWTKEVKDLYPENDRTLIKKRKNGYPWFGAIILLRWLYCLKQSKNSSQCISKLQRHFFTGIGKKSRIRGKKVILKFVWNHKRPQIAKELLSKKNKDVEIILSDFKNLVQSHSTQNSNNIKADELLGWKRYPRSKSQHL